MLKNNNNMNYKLDYISRLFEKTSKKRIENYVISRIWHLLNDEEIKLIPQQYVDRNNGQYALTDLYFPQINLHVEINEPAHYDSDERIKLDNERRQIIEKQTNHFVIEINCRGSLQEIHAQIDDTIDLIKNKITLQKDLGLFKAWNPETEFTPEYHKQVGFLRAIDNPCLKTIEDICKLFDAKVPIRGFLRKGGVTHPKNEKLLIWWPIENNKNWKNEISKNDSIIYEKCKDKNNIENHIKSIKNNLQQRITFFCQTDVLGFKFYRFKGIYDLDIQRTSIENGLVWVRINDTIKL